VDRIQQKVQGWKQKILSQASRSCLIRSVASTIPIYPMSSLAFPKSTCAKIDATLRDFWWGKTEGKGVLYFKSWDTICVPKEVCGLGFIKANDMNKALLTKMGWSVVNKEEKLWPWQEKGYCTLRGKSFWSVKKRNESSWAWQSILSSRSTLAKGACWRVSTGTSLDLWNAPWIPSLPGFKPKPKMEGVYSINWVSELIQENPRRWDRDKLEDCFDPDSVEKISLIPLGQYTQEDKLIWSPSSSGSFSTKIALWTDQKHRFENSGPLSNSEWKSLWRMKFHERLKLLLWKLAWNSLPTQENLGV
jgi:hypothetical protein